MPPPWCRGNRVPACPHIPGCTSCRMAAIAGCASSPGPGGGVWKKRTPMMFQVRFILLFFVPLSSFNFSTFLFLHCPFHAAMVSWFPSFRRFSFPLRFSSSFSMSPFKPRRGLRGGGRVKPVHSFSVGSCLFDDCILRPVRQMGWGCQEHPRGGKSSHALTLGARVRFVSHGEG